MGVISGGKDYFSLATLHKELGGVLSIDKGHKNHGASACSLQLSEELR